MNGSDRHIRRAHLLSAGRGIRVVSAVSGLLVGLLSAYSFSWGLGLLSILVAGFLLLLALGVMVILNVLGDMLELVVDMSEQVEAQTVALGLHHQDAPPSREAADA